QAAIQVLTQVANGCCVFGHGRLPPAVGHRLQQRDQRGGGRNDHVLLERRLQELRSLCQRCCQELVAGEEEDGELGAAFELSPVALGRELTHAGLHVLRMSPESDHPFLFCCGLERLQVCVERSFDINYQVARVWHVDYEIGP